MKRERVKTSIKNVGENIHGSVWWGEEEEVFITSGNWRGKHNSLSRCSWARASVGFGLRVRACAGASAGQCAGKDWLAPVGGLFGGVTSHNFLMLTKKK